MFGCYRRGDANDPDTYVAAVAMVLSHYPVNVIKAVTDPFCGLPSKKTESGWSGLPDVADVRAFCDAEVARLEKSARYEAWPKPALRLPKPPAGPGAFANVFVSADAPQYPVMLKRTETADEREWRYDKSRPGIWVALGWFDGPAQVAKHFKVPTNEDLLTNYGTRPAKEEAA